VGWKYSDSSVRGDGGDLAAAVGEDAGEAEEEGEEGAVGEDDEEAAGNPSVHVQPVAREHVPHRPCAEGEWGWGGASNDLNGCGCRVPSGATGRERAPKGEFLDCGAHGTINGGGGGGRTEGGGDGDEDHEEGRRPRPHRGSRPLWRGNTWHKPLEPN